MQLKRAYKERNSLPKSSPLHPRLVTARSDFRSGAASPPRVRNGLHLLFIGALCPPGLKVFYAMCRYSSIDRMAGYTGRNILIVVDNSAVNIKPLDTIFNGLGA